ncbi:hypothetical protein J421_1768 [Gemmatirosa kalamazoonensis]|uniref:Uncharacterized protein n=1 Tax=Gemmatirosa kalamazoonensis TaxID=861299 RepID=W0RG55_9BACT|nr:hypothetical protein J421_1768 [Gemmatirosa kalamazoonensis]
MYTALLTALDAVLEEGVPRASLVRAGLTTAQADEWQRGFVLAEELVRDLHAPHLRPGTRLRSTRLRTRLVVVAASLGALARQAGLDGVGHPGFAQLRDALDAAYAWAGAAHDEALRRALSASASESAA